LISGLLDANEESIPGKPADRIIGLQTIQRQVPAGGLKEPLRVAAGEIPAILGGFVYKLSPQAGDES